MNPNDDLRGAYHEVLLSPVGRDFMEKLIAHETDLQLQASRAKDHCEKATFIDQWTGVYWVRSLLADLSAPKKPRLTAATPRKSTPPGDKSR